MMTKRMLLWVLILLWSPLILPGSPRGRWARHQLPKGRWRKLTVSRGAWKLLDCCSPRSRPRCLNTLSFSSWPACPQYLLHSPLPQPFIPPITLLWSWARLWPMNCTLRNTSMDPISRNETETACVLTLNASYCITFSMVLSLSFCYETINEL